MHYGYFGVEKETWNRIAYRYEAQQELNAKEKAFYENNQDGFAIYQLKSIFSNDNVVFMNSQYLDSKNIPIDASRYSFRYSDDTKIIIHNVFIYFLTPNPDLSFSITQKLCCSTLLNQAQVFCNSIFCLPL